MNMVSHIVGGGLGIIVLLACLLRSIQKGSSAAIIGSAIYGGSMIAVFSVSSVYHGLHPSIGKKVLQVIDHCAIYFLIAGTYTPIMLSAFLPVYPEIGWSVLIVQWVLCIIAVTLTAIDLKKYNVFSMICYIVMGWCIIIFIPQTIQVLTLNGFYLLLSGGIVYTVGAILYGIGAKRSWFHSIFHIFVVLGSLLQFISILMFAI